LLLLLLLGDFLFFVPPVLSFLLVVVVVSIVLVLATRSFLAARSSLSRFIPLNFSIFSVLFLFASRKVSSANLLMALFVVVVVVVVASSSSLLLRFFFFGVALDDDDGVLLFIRRTFIFVVRSTRERLGHAKARARFCGAESENFFPISFVREKLQRFSFPGDENMRYLPIK
jgi:hypothetical protein